MKARLAYREFVLGGHMLALGTASIAATSSMLMNQQTTFYLLLMAYLFSYAAYSINRRAEMQQDMISNPERTKHLSSRTKYIPMITLAYFLAGYAIAVTINPYFFAVLILPLLLALAYSVGSKRLQRLIGAKRLKDKLLVKNLVVSISWALIPFIVSLYYMKLSISILPVSIFIFFRLMLNTLFFDLRDVEADRKFNVKTIPAAYGVERSFKLMILCDLASLAVIILSTIIGLLPYYSLLLIPLSLYSFYYRHLARRNPERIGFLCDVAADGEYLLWAPLLLAGRLLFSLAL